MSKRKDLIVSALVSTQRHTNIERNKVGVTAAGHVTPEPPN